MLESIYRSIVDLLVDLQRQIDTEVSPSVAWRTLTAQHECAVQLKAYHDPENMALELALLLKIEDFKQHVALLFDIGAKVTGPKRLWTEQFLAYARSENK